MFGNNINLFKIIYFKYNIIIKIKMHNSYSSSFDNESHNLELVKRQYIS